MGRQEAERREREQMVAEGGADARLIDRFSETRQARAARIARKTVNPDTAAALRRLWAA